MTLNKREKFPHYEIITWRKHQEHKAVVWHCTVKRTGLVVRMVNRTVHLPSVLMTVPNVTQVAKGCVQTKFKFSPACKNAAPSFIWMRPVHWQSGSANAESSSKNVAPGSTFARHCALWSALKLDLLLKLDFLDRISCLVCTWRNTLPSPLTPLFVWTLLNLNLYH